MTSMKRRFLIFHYQNPDLWNCIDRLSLEYAKQGRAHFGMQVIVEQARWETSIKTKGSLFKVSNDFTAHYSRMWMIIHPEHDGFFRTRPIPDDSLPDAKDYGPPPKPIIKKLY